MRFKTIADILDFSSAFHMELAERYRAIAHTDVEERSRLLLDYLVGQETRLAEALTRYKEKLPESVVNTWSDSATDIGLPPDVEKLREKFSAMTTADILTMAIDFHDSLITLYRHLADDAEIDTTRDIFINLAEQEHQDKLITVRDAQRLEDY